MNPEVFFSIATKVSLKENYSMTIDLINTVVDFFKNVTEQKFMICYVDSKAFRKNNFTDKNFDKLIERLKNNQVFSFISIEKRLTTDEYFGIGMMPEPEPEFGCFLSFEHPKFKEMGDFCDTIKMCFPTSFLEKVENQNKIIGLMKNIQEIMNGLCSFITIGNFRDDYSMDCAVFDNHFYHTSTEFSIHWDDYVRGYFWGQCLTANQVLKLGGLSVIRNQDFFLCEKWDDKVYIQSTEKILDYTMDDAMKMREFLKPLFPPESERRKNSYPHKEDFVAIKANGIYFYADEDMFLGE